MWYMVEWSYSRYLQVKGFRPCQEDTFAIYRHLATWWNSAEEFQYRSCLNGSSAIEAYNNHVLSSCDY